MGSEHHLEMESEHLERIEREQKVLLQCPCGKSYRVPAHMAGKRGRCPACGMVIRVSDTPAGVEAEEKPAGQPDIPVEASPRAEVSFEDDDTIQQPKPEKQKAASKPVKAAKSRAPKAFPPQSKPSLTQKLKNAAPKAQTEYLSKLKGIKNKVDTKILGERPDEGSGAKRYDYKRLSRLFFIFLTIFCLLFVGYLGKLYYDGSKADRAYKKLGADIVKAPSLEQRQMLYQEYIARFPESRRTVDVRAELENIPALIDTRDFNRAEKEAEQAGNKYEDVERLYLDYVKRHPKGQYLDKVQAALATLPQMAEERDYKRAIEAFDAAQNDPAQAEQALSLYKEKYPKGEHIEEISGKLKQVPDLKDELAYKKAMADVKELGDRFEEWKKPLNEYLDQFPRGRHIAEARSAIDSIPNKIDDAAFAKAMESENLPFGERPNGYQVYLDQYPQGRHVAEINQSIEEIPHQWADQIIQDIEKLDGEMRWPEAIDECQVFLRAYPHSTPSSRLQKYVRSFRRKMGTASDEMEFRKAEAMEKQPGADLGAVKQAYLAYLDKNPNGTFNSEAVERIKNLDSETVEQNWAKLRGEVLAPGADTRRSIDSINIFLAKYPKGDHVEEGREIITRLSERFEKENEPAVWAMTLKNIQNASNVGDALRLVDYFLRKYPDGVCREKALRKIVELEMRRYAALSPFPGAQAVCTVEVRGKEKQQGYSLTGQLREIDPSTYLLRDQANDAYYIKKADIAGVSYSPQAEYNKLLAGQPPRDFGDFVKIAQWSAQAGFNDKRLINLVMAAYLNPSDTRIEQTLASNGFSLNNGRWKSANGIW